MSAERILYVLKHVGTHPNLESIGIRPWGQKKLMALAVPSEQERFERLFYRQRINLPRDSTGFGRTTGTYYGFDKDRLMAAVAEELEDVVANTEQRLAKVREERDIYMQWLEGQVGDA